MKIYSINFVKNLIWDNHSNYLSRFQILEIENHFVLTEDLEIHIVELFKFNKRPEDLKTNFDYWMYFLKESENLKGEIMKALEKKSRVLKVGYS